MAIRVVLSLVLSCLLVPLAGCGGGDLESRVSGTVNCDGKPLEAGEIIFEDADGKTAPASSPIADGKYALKILPGKKKVLINATRPVKSGNPVMGTTTFYKSILGPEFNSDSKLTADIQPKTQDGVDFEVRSLP